MASEESIRIMVANCSGIAKEVCVPSANIHELGIDSLGLMSVVSNFEAQFSAEVDDATVLRLMAAKTVGEITSILKSCAGVGGG